VGSSPLSYPKIRNNREVNMDLFLDILFTVFSLLYLGLIGVCILRISEAHKLRDWDMMTKGIKAASGHTFIGFVILLLIIGFKIIKKNMGF
jgi:hypothetical protein